MKKKRKAKKKINMSIQRQLESMAIALYDSNKISSEILQKPKENSVITASKGMAMLATIAQSVFALAHVKTHMERLSKSMQAYTDPKNKKVDTKKLHAELTDSSGFCVAWGERLNFLSGKLANDHKDSKLGKAANKIAKSIHTAANLVTYTGKSLQKAAGMVSGVSPMMATVALGALKTAFPQIGVAMTAMTTLLPTVLKIVSALKMLGKAIDYCRPKEENKTDKKKAITLGHKNKNKQATVKNTKNSMLEELMKIFQKSAGSNKSKQE